MIVIPLVKVITYGPIGSFVIPLEALIKFSSLSLAINVKTMSNNFTIV